MELWQAEWCPDSHRVRQRLTELGLDYVAHQVPAERADRDALRAATGEESIPVLRDGEHTVSGPEAILAYLEGRFSPRPDAEQHRAMARDKVPQFEELAAGS